METVDSPTKLADTMNESMGFTIDYQTSGEPTPYDDVERALTLLREYATDVNSFDGLGDTVAPPALLFAQNGSSEQFLFEQGTLYRTTT